ncbi:development-specific 25 kDa protein [Glossina fuscipes]|uniref:Development-specific 25 kDa protein n=2 Tax=Nemorhina TaxID=44051 RepID=A0A8U0W594_9MUSC|nr:development-specific 25 kDa protein [Glossina fuscipes]KAI9586970.1 hypothetical protein GQX74_002817 [Glossina fuscipes]
MFNFTGKNVVYVGDFNGVGLQVCYAVVQKPIKNLVVCSRTENVEVLKKIQSLNSTVKVTFVQANVADRTSVDHAVKEIVQAVGHVDVLVNGTSVLADKDVDTTVAVNLTGVINTTLGLLPFMDKTQSGQGGVVVNVASVYGLEPGPAFSVYTAAKHGVVGFARSMANEALYKKTGVAFVCICPGLTTAEVMVNKRDQNNWLKWVPHTDDLWNAVTQSKTQTPEECAVNVVNVMDQMKNGGIYICQQGNVKEVVPTVYCTI